MKINNKPLIVLASIISILALLIILTPPIASMVLTYSLYEAGADEVVLGDVDINPLVGTARVHDLQVRKEGSRVLEVGFAYINLRMLSLFNKKLEIDEVILEKGYADIIESPAGVFGLRGLQFPAAPEAETQTEESPPSEWAFGVHGISVASTTLRLQAIKTTSTLRVDKLNLNKVYSWDKEGISELSTQGRFNQGRFSLETSLSPLARLPKVTGSLQFDALDLADIHPWIQDQLQELGGLVTLDSKIDISRLSETEWLVKLSPALNTTGLSIVHPEFSVQSQAIEYSGEPSLNLTLSEDSMKLALQDQGLLTIQGTSANAAQHVIQAGELSWSGTYTVKMTGADTDPEVMATGDIKLSELAVDGPEAVHLAKIRSTTISEATFELPMTINAAMIAVQDASLLQVSESKYPIASWDSVNIQKVAVTPELVHLNKVSVNQLGVHLTRMKNGDLHLPLAASDSPSPTKSDATDAEASAEKVTKAIGIRIDQLNIAKGSLVEFEDKSINPAYSAKVVFSKFSIGNINSSNINQAASLDISATINRYAQVSSKGHIKPFMDIPDAQIQTSLSGVNLTRVNPYSKQYSGYQVKNGSMNLDSDLKIQNSNIDETIKLKLKNLELEVFDKEKAAETDASLAIGLPAALGLLKDSNDDIKLNLPIKGDLKDPKFDFSDAIRVVLGKALTKASTTYVAYALQPWGAALLVKDVAGKMVTQVNLDPVVYEPASIESPENTTLYLKKISELMRSRPGIELKICGQATEADRMMLATRAIEEKRYLRKGEPTLEQARELIQDSALIDLAEERMFAIKDILIEQQQIPQDRLQTCLPKLDANVEALPRVDLKI
jgi:hypothetical protein